MRLVPKRAGVLLMFACGAAVFAPSFRAGQEKRVDFAGLFDKREVMIAMRDGVKLHTEIYSPKGAAEPLPILINRTPYGISSPDKGVSNMIYRYTDMAPDSYIFVFQAILRLYGSDAIFL